MLEPLHFFFIKTYHYYLNYIFNIFFFPKNKIKLNPCKTDTPSILKFKKSELQTL